MRASFRASILGELRACLLSLCVQLSFLGSNSGRPILPPMSSPTQSLPLIRLIILSVASLTICRANSPAVENSLVPQETPSAPAVRHTDWRKTLQAEFKYTQTSMPNPSVPAEAMSETPTNPDVVALPKYVVRDAAPDYRELEKAFRSQSQVTENVMMKKLGIGEHVVNFRHFSMGCYTIFFIPVSAGISW